MELIVVPWAAGRLLRLEAGGPTGDDLRRPSGVPVDASDPDVAALVGAYDAVWDAVWDATPPDHPVVVAAHTAVLRTASLLRFGPPAGPAEREYVRRQTREIRGLTGRDATGPLAYLRITVGGR